MNGPKALVGRKDLLVLVIILALAGGLFLFTRRNQPEKLVAIVRVGNQIERRVDLSSGEDHSFSLTGDLTVTIAVHDHTIAFVHSECPDQICVHAGELKKAGDMAACLPASISIVVEEE